LIVGRARCHHRHQRVSAVEPTAARRSRAAGSASGRHSHRQRGYAQRRTPKISCKKSIRVLNLRSKAEKKPGSVSMGSTSFIVE
jgi:hypothetical protein